MTSTRELKAQMVNSLISMKKESKREGHSRLSLMLVSPEQLQETEFSVLLRVLLMVVYIFPTTLKDSQDITLRKQPLPLIREVRFLKKEKLLVPTMPRNTEITSMVSMSNFTWIT
jgi:hypothetical protein